MALKKLNREDEKKLISLVKERFKKAQSARLNFERQWHLNLAFLEGNQYSFWNDGLMKLDTLKPVPHRIRYVSNIILPYYNREIAKLGKNDPAFNVIENSDDDEDITAARLAEHILQYLWREKNLSEMYLQLRTWLVSCGTGFIVAGWDPSAGNYREIYKQEEIYEPEVNELGEQIGTKLAGIEAVMDKDGNPVVDDKNSFWEGDVFVETVSPFMVFPANSNLQTVEAQPWIITARFKSIADVKLRYGETGSQVKVDKGDLAESYKLAPMLEGKTDSEDALKEEDTLVIEMREKPSPDYLRGRITAVSGDIILRYDDLPYGKYDLLKFVRTRKPGCFWGASQIEPSIPLQKQWNKIMSSVAEHRETLKKAKILIPSTAEVHKSAFTTEHAEIILYNPMGGPPFQMNMHPLPGDIWKEADELVERMQDIWSQHEVTKAQVPGQVKSGIAIEQLIEQDETSLAPIYQNLNWGLVQCGHQVLRIIEDNYAEKRLVKIVGEDLSTEITTFVGADLRGSNDVVVQLGSALPQLRISRMQEFKDRYTMGLYGDPKATETKRKVLKLLGDSTIVKRTDDYKLDEQNQKREYAYMLASREYVGVKTYDDHEIHINMLQHIRKTFACQRAVAENPTLDQLLERHLMEHGQAFMGQMQPATPDEQLSGQPPEMEAEGTAPPEGEIVEE